MRTLELLEPKYAFLVSENDLVTEWKEVNQRCLQVNNISKPWYRYQRTMVFGRKLVNELGLDAIKQHKQKGIYYFEWLKGQILWLNDTWGLWKEWEEDGRKFTEETRKAEMEHKAALDEILNLKEEFENRKLIL